ncbi:MAG: hypothetical protein R2856_22170 [Caldilineaceae bacterium]
MTPSYAGMQHPRLAGDGLTWPCPSPEHPGTPILHTERFSRGLGKLHNAAGGSCPPKPPTPSTPLILSTGRILPLPYRHHDPGRKPLA